MNCPKNYVQIDESYLTKEKILKDELDRNFEYWNMNICENYPFKRSKASGIKSFDSSRLRQAKSQLDYKKIKKLCKTKEVTFRMICAINNTSINSNKIKTKNLDLPFCKSGYIYDEFKNPSFKYNMTLYQELAIATGCGIKNTNIDDCVARWIGFITQEELEEVKKDRKLMKGIIVAINEMNRQQNQSQNEPSEEQKQQTLAQQAQGFSYSGYDPIKEKILNRMGWTQINPIREKILNRMGWTQRTK